MIITIFEPCGVDELIPKHKKPTFTDVAIKIGLLHVRILRLRSNLDSFDKALDDMHDCIMELEEVVNND